jgi:hypothetical protein
MPKQALKPQTPGEQPAITDPGLSDDDQQENGQEQADEHGEQASDDAAIAAGQMGRAHKIAKPRAPVAPANLGPRADTTRPQSANINASQQVATTEAKALDREGKLQRPALTESGWYVPLNSFKERAARKKQGEPEFIDIE